jgi:hypothetical protein
VHRRHQGRDGNLRRLPRREVERNVGRCNRDGARRRRTSRTTTSPTTRRARTNTLGQILVEIIPKLDKPGKSYPIRTEDGKTHLVPIGQDHKDWKTGQDRLPRLEERPVQRDRLDRPERRHAAAGRIRPRRGADQRESGTHLGDRPQMFRADDTAGSEQRAEALERYINLKFPGLIPPKEGEGQQIPQQVQQQIVGLQQELQKAHGVRAVDARAASSEGAGTPECRPPERNGSAFKREELAEKSASNSQSSAARKTSSGSSRKSRY